MNVTRLGFTAGTAHRAAGGNEPHPSAWWCEQYAMAFIEGWREEHRLQSEGKGMTPAQASRWHNQVAKGESA